MGWSRSAFNFTAVDLIKALFWSALISGIVGVPVMATMMLMTRRKDTWLSSRQPSASSVGWQQP